jgi:diguanylate cyclase (GGDEF)-like protein
VVIDEVKRLRLEVSELSQLVRTDTLTGLYNFRHFREVLSLEMERSHRSYQPTALVMVDLDHFKKVNDRWGHEVGNQALITAAKAMHDCVRQLDVACRYGGEEFAIILPASNLLTAKHVANRVCETIAATPVMVDGEDIGLTASLGIAIFSANQHNSVEELVERADKALYQAKQNGRNQVCYEEQDNKPLVSVSSDEKAALAGLFDSES